MNLIFLGPPGAGKGTHAQLLMQELSIPQISTGEILRSAIRQGTPTGLKAKACIEKGELVPDEVVIDIVKERLQQDDCRNGYILDGFPRTVAQAEALAGFAKLSGRRVCPKCGNTTHVSLLKGSGVCPSCGETLVQRKDDLPETVVNRLKVYAEQTAPLIDYYRRQGIIRDIPCDNHTLEENHALVHACLGMEG